ncbi:MAG: cadherin repeat domain-containing protein, partial [Halieaceae bacterium]|nr:cadherin repeat domain-containing protein [Halieaceae bacterium]
YTAVATDDGDVSGGVSFSLSADSAAGVEIDAVSGEVSLTASADFETAESYSFTVVATDVAGNKTTKAVTVDVTNLDEVAPVITSGATADAIAENTAVGALVYTATATDEDDISEGITFSLAEGSDPALSINAQTGEVTLNESPDFETQESYSFTVVATDGAGNNDEQAVTLAVTNVDDSAPSFVSPTTGAALTATPFLYQAVADDSGDAISAGVTYSLAAGGDSDLLEIDPTDGVVTVKSGLVDPAVQNAYTFTVVADDGVNDPVTQSVTLTVPEANVVLGSGVLQQGGIRIVDTDNGDGTYTLEFFVSDEFASDFPDGAGNYDFVFNYDATQFEAIAATDYTTDFALPTVNAEVAGRLVVGAIDLNALDLASGTPLGQLIVTPTSDADLTVSITDLIVNESDLPGTTVVYGDPTMFSGTEAIESFVLAGGDAEVTGGEGVDVFVVTDSTGEQMTVTDYTADDVIDFSYALIQAGYNSAIDDTVPSVSAGQASELVGGSLDDVAGIMANEAAYDNTYGAVVDVEAGQILGYYDANPAAGVVDTVGFRLNIGEAAASLMGVDIAAIVNTGAAFTSGATGGSVTENDPSDLLVYTAAVELEEGQSVTFSLAAGVEELFGIDAQTGQVTFIGTADYEAASTLGFTVIATDNEGNASRQSVSIDVVNQDDTAPTWVSGTSFTALANTPFVYAAEATDDADVSLEPVQYSLDPNSADADLLFIDSETGIVTLQQGVLVPGGKQAFTFTVVATDGVNDPVSQQVVASIGATTAVQGTGVLAQGGIQVVDVDNGDGTFTLEFYVDSAVAGQFANGVENYDFVFNYSPDQFEAIAAGDYTTSFSLPTVNDEVAGKLVVSAIDLTALNLADGTPLGSLTVTPLVVDGVEVSVTDVIVNTTDLDSTQIVYGETVIVSGTADNDTFTLLGGDTEITGGDGIDAYIVTETTGNQVY